MNGKSYGKLYEAINKASKKEDRLLIGEMKSSNTCLIKEQITLDTDDLYFPDEKIEFKSGDLVLLYKMLKDNEDKYLIICKVVER